MGGFEFVAARVAFFLSHSLPARAAVALASGAASFGACATTRSTRHRSGVASPVACHTGAMGCGPCRAERGSGPCDPVRHFRRLRGSGRPPCPGQRRPFRHLDIPCRGLGRRRAWHWPSVRPSG